MLIVSRDLHAPPCFSDYEKNAWVWEYEYEGEAAELRTDKNDTIRLVNYVLFSAHFCVSMEKVTIRGPF